MKNICNNIVYAQEIQYYEKIDSKEVKWGIDLGVVKNLLILKKNPCSENCTRKIQFLFEKQIFYRELFVIKLPI